MSMPALADGAGSVGLSMRRVHHVISLPRQGLMQQQHAKPPLPGTPCFLQLRLHVGQLCFKLRHPGLQHVHL